MLHHFAEGELAGAPLVKSTNFRLPGRPEHASVLLTSVSVMGYRKGDDDRYLSGAMPPVEFDYSRFEPEKQRYQSVTAEGNDLPPRSLDAAGFSLVDLFGDGLPDIVRTSPESYDIWRNLRRRLYRSAPATARRHPAGVAFPERRCLWRHGRRRPCDLLVGRCPPCPAFSRQRADGQWQPFRRFARFPSLDLADPELAARGSDRRRADRYPDHPGPTVPLVPLPRRRRVRRSAGHRPRP